MKEYPIKYMTNYTAVTVGFKAFADGFEPSDMVESEYTATGPIINIVDYHVLNIIADICVSHDYNIYIDDVYVATVAYTPGSIAQYELATYVDNAEMHKVHIISVGTGLLQNRSNDAYMYCPIYGVTGLTSVNTALQRTGDAINLTWAFDANGMLNSDFDDVFPWNEAVFETHDQYRQFIRLPDMYFTIETTPTGSLSAVSVSKQPNSDDGNTYFVKSFCVGRYEGEYNTFSGRYKLLSAPCTSFRAVSLANYRQYAKEWGADYSVMDAYHHNVLALLWLIEFAERDGRNTMIGHSINQNSVYPGYTDTLTKPSGFASPFNKYSRMRWHYIEDFIGNRRKYLEGLIYNYTTQQYLTADARVADFGNWSKYTVIPGEKKHANTNPYVLEQIKWNPAHPFILLPAALGAIAYPTSGYATIYRGPQYNETNVPLATGCYYADGQSDLARCSGPFSQVWYFRETSSAQDFGARLMYVGDPPEGCTQEALH